MNSELERCGTCTVPVTWETVHLDSCGNCNICKNWGVKKNDIDWSSRSQELEKIVQDVKLQKNEYDCILPFSGGKDSTYTLWYVVKKLGLKPLVVSFDHGFYRPNMLQNRTNAFKKLGVDVLTFTPNWIIVKKLMLESLIRKGDFCWHCHAGIFSYPMNIAVKFKIPFLIWGEGGGEYEAYFQYANIEETDEWKFNRRIVLGMRAEDLAGFIGVEPRDLSPYTYPEKKELEKIGAKSLPLGNFIPWDVRRHVEVIKRDLDWKEDEIESGFPGLTYEKIECAMQGVRDYVKYLKRGFSRITHLTTLDIRHGRMSREEALSHISNLEHRKPRSLEVFLSYLGITETEFNEIVAKHVIHPHVGFDPNEIPYGKKLNDQDQWYQDKVNSKL